MQSADHDVNLLEFSIHPPKGWLRYKRDKFGITGFQLAAKMGVTKQRISALEKSELSGAASIKTMRQAAEALGCEFVYALVPKGSQSFRSSSLQVDPLKCMQLPQCRDQVTEICSQYHIKNLGVYGAAARGELNEASDINLLAEFEGIDTPSVCRMEQIELRFSRLFARKTTLVSQAMFEEAEFIDAVMLDLQLVYQSD